MYRAVVIFFLWAFCYLGELHPFSILEPLSVSGSSKGIIAVQAISSSLVYRAKIARLVMSGTFAFAISRLRTERPSLRPWHHIGRLRDRKSSLNLTLLLYQIFFDFSNERSLRVSNATTRADGLGRSLVCRQERLTRYIQSYLIKVLGLTNALYFLLRWTPGQAK